ncbi:hypothetical protein [Mesorhizobium sp. M1182]
MDGARFLSMRTAQAKARTAASINAATGGIAFEWRSQPVSHRRAT